MIKYIRFRSLLGKDMVVFAYNYDSESDTVDICLFKPEDDMGIRNFLVGNENPDRDIFLKENDYVELYYAEGYGALLGFEKTEKEKETDTEKCTTGTQTARSMQ